MSRDRYIRICIWVHIQITTDILADGYISKYLGSYSRFNSILGPGSLRLATRVQIQDLPIDYLYLISFDNLAGGNWTTAEQSDSSDSSFIYFLIRNLVDAK